MTGMTYADVGRCSFQCLTCLHSLSPTHPHTHTHPPTHPQKLKTPYRVATRGALSLSLPPPHTCKYTMWHAYITHTEHIHNTHIPSHSLIHTHTYRTARCDEGCYLPLSLSPPLTHICKHSAWHTHTTHIMHTHKSLTLSFVLSLSLTH